MKFLLSIFIIFVSISQADFYRIYLLDKGVENLNPESEEYKIALNSLSERAIERRIKHLGDTIITEQDLPINSGYLSSISNYGEILLQVKWFNYIIADIDSINVEIVSEFPFVKKIELANQKTVIQKIEHELETEHINYIMSGIYNYGKASNQIEMLNIPPLHKMGFNGENTRIGFLDAGFDAKLALARFPDRNIENYDFVGDDNTVEYEENDPKASFHHGTQVMSIVLGYLQDSLIGASTASEYLLARTEDVGKEVQLETDYFVAGIEWLESKGCNVVNSSLGYRFFNDGQESFDFADLDGRSTLLAKSINLSTHFGVVHSTSAGNYGSDGDSTLISPADADSVLSVAGVNILGKSWNLSSKGPRARKGLFPNISAQGASVALSTTDDPENPRVGLGGGTSFASPLIAGCASLLRSAFPELMSYEIRNILYQSSSNYDEPNLEIGHGVPDMIKAFEIAGVAISNPSQYQVEDYERIASYIFSKDGIDDASIHIYNPETLDYKEFKLRSKDGLIYYFDITENFFESDSAKYFLTVTKNGKSKRLPNKEQDYLFAIKGKEEIVCGVDALELPIHVDSIDTNIEFDVSDQIKNINGVLEIGNLGSQVRNINVSIIDMQGKICLNEDFNLNSKNRIRLSGKLSSGLFIVNISAVNFNISKKITNF